MNRLTGVATAGRRCTDRAAAPLAANKAGTDATGKCFGANTCSGQEQLQERRPLPARARTPRKRQGFVVVSKEPANRSAVDSKPTHTCEHGHAR